MKRLLGMLAGALLAIGLASVPAGADTITSLNAGNPIAAGSYESFFGGAGGPGHAFTDTINFNLSTTESLTGALVNFAVSPFFNIAGLSLSLDGSLVSLSSLGTFSFASLASGSHYFTVSGLTAGFFGGVYGFGFTTAAATPIPPALIMFLTALGGLGFFVWRRNRHGSAALMAA